MARSCSPLGSNSKLRPMGEAVDGCGGIREDEGAVRMRQGIRVSFEPYDPDEFRRWSTNDQDVVERILGRTGPLGRSLSVFRNQLGRAMQPRNSKGGGGYNYAELKLADSLIAREWPRDSIIYENYYLSRLAESCTSGLTGVGCALVRQAFSSTFLIALDGLIDCNPSLFRQKHPKAARVDLFAFDRTRGRVGLWEAKRYNPLSRATEAIGDHQRALLAFTSYLASQLGDAAFAVPGLRVEVGLVVFVPTNLPTSERERAVAETDRYCEFDVEPV